MKKMNLLMIVSMIIGTLYYLVFKFNSDRILTYLAIIPVIIAPLVLVKSKFKLGGKELCSYYIFVFMAYFIGCVVNLYNTTNWYDVFVHFCSGIFSFFAGLFIIDRLDIGKVNLLYRVFFSFLVVMSVASLWELFEFGADSLLGMNLQHSSDTGVMDTMIDILVAFIGGILSSFSYYIVKKNN